MESNPKDTRRPMVVILNASLANGEIHRLLQTRRCFRIKVTQSTERDSVILPVKSIAYLVVSISELARKWPSKGDKTLNEDTIQRIEKFSSIHRNCHLLLLTKMTTEDEFNIFKELQHRFWKSPLVIYPVASAKQCIRMLEKASTLNNDANDAYTSLLNGNLGEEMTQSILEENLGITSHQSLVLLDGCQNIANIACFSEEELIERCPLSRDCVKRIRQFFQQDCVSM
ncbi:uncharacterized protein LOC135682167 [Rhopilema esculentum]|uniref:uncharacterized protein LOC135682167 n=1 Tax=Rhopilema esculentum TaxID=499914 RepID=UPI0031D0E576